LKAAPRGQQDACFAAGYTGNVTELKNALLRAAAAGPEELARWSAGARACAQTCSRSAFRTVLVGAVERALATAG
jgi:hypothetical protein